MSSEDVNLKGGADGGAGSYRLICVNCGSLMIGLKCKLRCSQNCGYFESCSDLEAAPSIPKGRDGYDE